MITSRPVFFASSAAAANGDGRCPAMLNTGMSIWLPSTLSRRRRRTLHVAATSMGLPSLQVAGELAAVVVYRSPEPDHQDPRRLVIGREGERFHPSSFERALRGKS